MIFNGVDFTELPDLKFRILNIEGRNISPSHSLVTVKPLNYAGEILSRRSINSKVIKVTADIKKLPNKDTLRDLGNLLYHDILEYKQLIFLDEINKYWNAVLMNEIEIVEKNYSFYKIIISFLCEPYAYSINETMESNINEITLTNSGTLKCMGIITFTIPSGTEQLIKLNGTLSQIKLEDTDLSGDWVIDMKKRTVLKNGVLANIKTNFQLTNWVGFHIPVGVYQFDFTPAQNATLTYRRMYK